MRWIHSAGAQRRLLVLLLCAPLFGLIGVAAAEIIPDTQIADHLVDAERVGILGPSDQGPTPLGTTPARYSECTAFSVGLGDPAGENLASSAVLGTAYTGCERLLAALAEYEETGELRSGFAYLRYWHGYAVLTRPSLGIFGVAGTRWIAFAFMALAVGGMCVAVKRRLGAIAAALLAVPTMLTTDVVIGSLSASTAIGTGAAWVAGWLSFVVVSRRAEWQTASLIAALAGAITAYLDLMTTMPGSFALTVVGATLGASVAGLHAISTRAWLVTGAAAIGWVTGLVWMWVSKWIIAAFVVGPDAVVETVKSQIGFRLSGGSHGASESRVRGLTINLSRWWDQPLTAWVVAATLATLVVAAIRWRRGPADLARIAVCCGLAAAPVVGWYLALNNHSQIHPQLVYRSLPIAFGAIAALAYVGSKRSNGAQRFVRDRDAEGGLPVASTDADDTDQRTVVPHGRD
jgi:hypothetical protein